MNVIQLDLITWVRSFVCQLTETSDDASWTNLPEYLVLGAIGVVMVVAVSVARQLDVCCIAFGHCVGQLGQRDVIVVCCHMLA